MNTNRLRHHSIAILFFTALIATGISQAQAIAGPNLVWSDNPGAYEQHLMRRYENRLFPKYRRHITQSEIDSARERDLKDYAGLNKRLIKLAEDISVLPDHVDSATINRIREIIDDLIQDAMGVGGRAYDIALKTKELRQTLISSWSKAVPGNPEAQRALVLAELYYQKHAAKFEVPFIAQMVREDGPIPSNEVVPALLMEKPNIIAMVLGWVEPSKHPAVQKGALQVLKASIEEGAQIDNMEEILEALGVNAN